MDSSYTPMNFRSRAPCSPRVVIRGIPGRLSTPCQQICDVACLLWTRSVLRRIELGEAESFVSVDGLLVVFPPQPLVGLPVHSHGVQVVLPLAELQARYLGRRGGTWEYRFALFFADQLLGGGVRYLVP